MSISEALGESDPKGLSAVSSAPAPTSTAAPVGTAPSTEPVVSAKADPILDAIMSRIQPVSTVKHKRKVLLYSDPGAGKTVFAATAPKPLIHDTENGSASINNHPELAAKTRVLPFVSMYQFEQLVERLAEHGNALDDVETYVIDTLSNLHKTGLADTVVAGAAKNNMKNEFVAETEDHTENNERIRRVVSKLNSLDRNIIILCHAKKIQRPDKSFVTSPDFSDKLTNAINALVDVVGYMYEKEENGQIVRIVRLRSNGNIVAKTRFVKHPIEMVNPTWDKLFEGIAVE